MTIDMALFPLRRLPQTILALVIIQETVISKMRDLIWFNLLREKPLLT